MKQMLITTALLSALLALPVYAQSTDTGTDAGTDAGTPVLPGDDTALIPTPEGYTAFDTATLTIEDLNGVTVIDAEGISIGRIDDFVFDAAGITTETIVGSTDAGVAGTDAGQPPLFPDPAATDTAGTEATGTEPMETDTAETDATGTEATGVAPAETDTAEADPAADPAATDTTGAGTDLASTGVDSTLSGDMMALDGKISHVVIDVGGFLGIGTHTVAIPISELQVFRGEGSIVRAYLPWTEAQLKALPAYEKFNPATLGSADTAPTN